MQRLLRHFSKTPLGSSTPKGISTTTDFRAQKSTHNMPLVVPGLNSADKAGGNETLDWTNRLVGKTLCDGPSSETVCRVYLFLPVARPAADQIVFLRDSA